jgi:hypothetical protein
MYVSDGVKRIEAMNESDRAYVSEWHMLCNDFVFGHINAEQFRLGMRLVLAMASDTVIMHIAKSNC